MRTETQKEWICVHQLPGQPSCRISVLTQGALLHTSLLLWTTRIKQSARNFAWVRLLIPSRLHVEHPHHPQLPDPANKTWRLTSIWKGWVGTWALAASRAFNRMFYVPIKVENLCFPKELWFPFFVMSSLADKAKKTYVFWTARQQLHQAGPWPETTGNSSCP